MSLKTKIKNLVSRHLVAFFAVITTAFLVFAVAFLENSLESDVKIPVSQAAVLGDDANLADISLQTGSLDPAFNPNSLFYYIDIFEENTSLSNNIDANPNDPAASVLIDQVAEVATTTSQSDRTALITVTAADGVAEKVYTLIYRLVEPGHDANLTSLAVSQGNLSPIFAPGTTDYTVELQVGTTQVPTVYPVSADSKASVDIVNATDLSSENQVDRTTTVAVLAEDGTTQKTYSITFNLSIPADCTESDWSYNDSECRDGNTKTRTWTKTGTCQGGVSHPENETISCNFVPECDSTNWSYTDGACQPDDTKVRTWTKTGTCQGGLSHPATENIPCTYVPNIPTCISSDWSYTDGACQSDNTKTRTWTKTGTCQGGANHPATESLECSYNASDDSTLSSVTVENGLISPEFDSEIHNYVITVPEGQNFNLSDNISATVNDSKATKTISQIKYFSKDQSAQERTAKVAVTAEDTSYKTVYRFTYLLEEKEAEEVEPVDYVVEPAVWKKENINQTEGTLLDLEPEIKEFEFLEVKFKKEVQNGQLTIQTISDKDLLDTPTEGRPLMSLQADYENIIKDDLTFDFVIKLPTGYVNQFDQVKAYNLFDDQSVGDEDSDLAVDQEVLGVSEMILTILGRDDDKNTLFALNTEGFDQISIVGVDEPEDVVDKDKDKNEPDDSVIDDQKEQESEEDQEGIPWLWIGLGGALLVMVGLAVVLGIKTKKTPKQKASKDKADDSDQGQATETPKVSKIKGLTDLISGNKEKKAKESVKEIMSSVEPVKDTGAVVQPPRPTDKAQDGSNKGEIAQNKTVNPEKTSLNKEGTRSAESEVQPINGVTLSSPNQSVEKLDLSEQQSLSDESFEIDKPVVRDNTNQEQEINPSQKASQPAIPERPVYNPRREGIVNFVPLEEGQQDQVDQQVDTNSDTSNNNINKSNPSLLDGDY